MYTQIHKFTSKWHSQATRSIWSRDSQDQEMFLTSSADKQTATMTQSAQTIIPPFSPYQH